MFIDGIDWKDVQGTVDKLVKLTGGDIGYTFEVLLWTDGDFQVSAGSGYITKDGTQRKRVFKYRHKSQKYSILEVELVRECVELVLSDEELIMSVDDFKTVVN